MSSHFTAWPVSSIGQAHTQGMASSFSTWPSAGSSFTSTPGSASALPAWPWLGSGQFNLQPYLAGNPQVSGAPSTSWPYMGAQLGGWAALMVHHPVPAPVTPAAGVGVWPYPSVPDDTYHAFASLAIWGLSDALGHPLGTNDQGEELVR